MFILFWPNTNRNCTHEPSLCAVILRMNLKHTNVGLCNLPKTIFSPLIFHFILFSKNYISPKKSLFQKLYLNWLGNLHDKAGYKSCLHLYQYSLNRRKVVTMPIEGLAVYLLTSALCYLLIIFYFSVILLCLVHLFYCIWTRLALDNYSE